MFRGLQINRELLFLQFGGLVKRGGNYCNEKKKTIYDFSFINIYIYIYIYIKLKHTSVLA